jgi:chromosome segregation ATPase
MSVDNLSQKFQRELEQLDKFGKDVSQKINDFVTKFSEITGLLDSLQSEKGKLENQNTEEGAKIASLKDEIGAKTAKKQELNNKLDAVKTELQNVNNHLNNEEEEKTKLKEKFSSVNEKVDRLNNESVQIKERVDSLQKENAELNRQLNEEMINKKSENTKFKSELQELMEQHGVVSFLLEESAENLNEVDILMGIMSKSKATKNDLKELLEGKVTPVIITRTLGKMVDKNILKYSEANDEYSLA